MKRRFDISLLLLPALVLLVTGSASAQEDTWLFTASAGYGHFFLKEVNFDLERDIEGYREAGYPIPRFKSISPTIAMGGRVEYRFDRDLCGSLSLLHASRTVSTSFDDGQRALALRRKVGSTAVMLGLGQHFAAGMDGDVFVEVQMGMLFGRAASTANRTRTYKTDTVFVFITEILDDTEALYTKSKLVVALAAGGTVRLIGGIILRGEAVYRFAQIGKIDGEVTTFRQTRPQTTSVNFDFSGFALSLGAGIELNR